MKAALIAIPLLALAAPPSGLLEAQTIAGQTIKRVVVYGRDPCPRGEGDEIVICARRPSTERYRIPEALRDDTADDPASMSWAARSESLEYVGRTGTQSCSTVGPGGFTGCWSEMMRAAQGERAAPDATPK
jgi:hypothetical protein